MTKIRAIEILDFHINVTDHRTKMKVLAAMDFYGMEEREKTEEAWEANRKQLAETINQLHEGNLRLAKILEDKKMKLYEQEFVCKHTYIEEMQGGQIERCRQCGKTWG